ncbi:unnamed protein product, partial [Scytosiphon promiscuus]
GGGAGGAGGVPDDASALQAQRCELCREKLVFRARYRPGAPAQLGLFQFLRGAARRATPRLMDAFRGVLNMQMWGLGVPIMYCHFFRIGLGLSLLFAQEVASLFSAGAAGREEGGDGGILSPVLATAGAGRGASLPGLERVGWGDWMDLLGDWCGGVGLMIGVMCLGPPCVELALEFVNVVKALPLVLERWWLGDDGPRAALQPNNMNNLMNNNNNNNGIDGFLPPGGNDGLGNQPFGVGGPFNENVANFFANLGRDPAQNHAADGAAHGAAAPPNQGAEVRGGGGVRRGAGDVGDAAAAAGFPIAMAGRDAQPPPPDQDRHVGARPLAGAGGVGDNPGRRAALPPPGRDAENRRFGGAGDGLGAVAGGNDGDAALGGDRNHGAPPARG